MDESFSIADAASAGPVPQPPPVVLPARSVHPLDRRDDDTRSTAAEHARIRLAWAKLIWLLSFLAVLLAISYLVPYIVEQTQYAATRGRQRAEHDFAQEHLGESPIGDLSRAYQMVSQVVGPSVVHINTQGTETAVQLLNYRPRGRIPTEGQGSGIIVEASGYILTNWHVVRDATQINVSLSDGDRRPARLIGHDGATDLAVLKIDGGNVTPANWGDSDKAQPG